MGSLLRVFVVRISDSEPVGGDSWCWKALQHGGWVALMGYAQEETAEEAWDLAWYLGNHSTALHPIAFHSFAEIELTFHKMHSFSVYSWFLVSLQGCASITVIKCPSNFKEAFSCIL